MDTIAQPKVEISLAGALITILETTIAELWLERARLKDAPPVASSTLVIGAVVNGQTFMGIVRGDGGARDHRLWDLGESSERMNHADATTWAESKGGSLPTRREQSVMFGNRGEGQYKAEWYWSCEQYAGIGANAWVQNFNDGIQDGDHKSYDCGARAVRREPIQ